jgi:hypothetical protein
MPRKWFDNAGMAGTFAMKQESKTGKKTRVGVAKKHREGHPDYYVWH